MSIWLCQLRKMFVNLLLPWIIAIMVAMLARLYLLFTYSTGDLLPYYTNDLTRLFWFGLLFDIRVASLAFVPLLLISAIFCINLRLVTLWQKILPWFSCLFSLMLTTLTIGNIYYYATYQRPIDIFAFGLFDDDTTAILTTIWQDYPVIRVVFTLAAFSWVILRLYQRWQHRISQLKIRPYPLPLSILLTLALFSIGFIGMRGSIGTFPLRQSDAQISSLALLNTLTPNGAIALSWAYSDYKKHYHFDPALDEDGSRLLSQFFNHPTTANFSPLYSQTSVNTLVEKQPPHVVVAIMESMGEHLLSLDQSDRDLLGELRQHWQNDWLFSRFISEGDGTIDTLSRFFVRSPMANISQSSAQNIPFISNMIQPYLSRGYKVVFITSGNGGWQNLNQFLPHLGVSEFVEQNTLKTNYPEATVSTWGVADEFMFQYAQQRLIQAEKDGDPLLIIMMSTTHHPPYKIPTNYPAVNFHLSPQEQQRLSHLAQGNELNTILNTLRYANDQLGQFISKLKTQALGNKTIVAVTGDHNIRGIGYPDPSERALGHAVPFYLYVPKAYQRDSYFDLNRVGSHKDIWPTLYSLSLSNSKFYQMGCNLLAKVLNPFWCLGYNPEVLISTDGAYFLSTKETDPNRFRPWANSAGLLLAQPTEMTTKQQQESHRWQAMTPLLKWQLDRQVGQANQQK